MVDSIEVQKFKKFENPIRIEGLSGVNYLVGKNNAGKSSFLQAVLLSTLYRNEAKTNFSSSGFSFTVRTYQPLLNPLFMRLEFQIISIRGATESSEIP